MPGLVVAREARVGAVAVASGPPLFALARDGAMQLHVDVATATFCGSRPIRALGDQGDAGRLAGLPIALPTGRQVRLSHLGTVVDGFEEARPDAQLDAREVVVVSLIRAKEASEASVAAEVDAGLVAVRAAYPGAALADTAVTGATAPPGRRPPFRRRSSAFRPRSPTRASSSRPRTAGAT